MSYYSGAAPEQQTKSDSDQPERYAPPRRRTSALDWAKAQEAEEQRRKDEATRKRLETRARNAEARSRFKVPVPKTVKPAAFYVSHKMNRDWFPDEHHWWCGCYLVNLIRWRQITWRANPEGYTQLLYRYLEKIIDRPVLKAIKQILEHRQAVECDHDAVINKKAYGYRLTPDYQETHRIVCTDAEVNRKIAVVYGEEERELLPIHRWLRGKFDLLHFDLEKALAIIARMKPDKDSGLTTAEYRSQRREYIQRIADGDHWFTADNYGRVHTPLTALEEELRCCLSVDGHPLVNIDLANSQPLIFSILVEQLLTTSKMTRSRIRTRKFDSNNPYHATNQSLNTLHPTQPNTKPTQHPTQTANRIKDVNRSLSSSPDKELRDLRPVTLPEAFLEFRRVCERGEFYESMMTDQQRTKGKKARDRLKVLFYGVLFGENRSRSRFENQTRIRFRQRYPTVARVLRELKKRNYRHSSHLLQNWEATIFIHRICGRIREERANIPVFTIHDSILTTSEYVPYVKAIIIEEFQKLGVTPTLKEETYQ